MGSRERDFDTSYLPQGAHLGENGSPTCNEPAGTSVLQWLAPAARIGPKVWRELDLQTHSV